jgi:O-antigen/teichoic acid export membrane protein
MPENYTRRAVRGTATVFLLGAGASILAYLLRLALARTLGPGEYGLIYAIFALFGLFSVFQHLGLQEALVRHIAEYRVKGRYGPIKAAILAVLGSQFLTAGILALLGILLADWLALHYFHQPIAATLVRLYALSILLSPLDITLTALFQGWQRMDLFALVNFLRMAAVLAATLALLKLGLGIQAPIIAYILMYGIHLFLFVPVFLTRVFPGFLAVKAEMEKPLLRSLFRYGLAVMLTSAAGIIITYTDTAMLTALRPLEEVGHYNAAMPTTRILWLFAQSLSLVLFPLTTELWLRKPHYLRQGLELLYRHAALIIIPAAAIMLAFPELMLRILFGPAYEPAAPALRILAVAAIIYTLGTINSAVLSGIGKPQANSIISWAAAIGNALGNILLIPSLGAAGAATSTLIAFTLILGLSTAVLRRHVAFTLPWLHWLKALIAGGIFLGVLILAKNTLSLPVWPETLLAVGSAAIAYALGILALKAVDLQEYRELLARVKAQ